MSGDMGRHCTYFEGVESLVWVHFSPGGADAVRRQLFYLRQDIAL